MRSHHHTVSRKNVMEGRYKLDVEVGGTVRFDEQPTNSRHKHNYFEACLVTSGSGRYDHGAECFLLTPDSVFLAEPGVAHEISSFETRDLILFFVSFSVVDSGTNESAPEDKLIGSFLESHRIAGRASLSGYLPLLQDRRRFAYGPLLRTFCLEMVEVLTDRPTLVHDAVEPPDVQRAVAFVEAHIGERLTVEEVADHVGISSRSLRRKFRAATGQTVAEAINQRRMVHAAHRLLMGFSVGEAAHDLGIRDPAQFTRAFTRAIGVPPKRFQQTYMPGGLVRRTEFGA